MNRTPEQLKLDLKQFYGTEQYYKLTLLPLLATDGVAYFANEANAYWLISDIAANIEALNEPFVCVKAIGNGEDADVIYDDGNNNVLKKVHYDYSDLPVGEWKFFVTNNVIMLPSEY